MKNLNFVIFVDRKYVKAISLVKTKSFETIFMSTFGIYIYIYIYMYIYERETSVCMCYTITVKQKTQRLFDEFSYSFNT